MYIKSIVKSLTQITNYNGKIEYDISKPSGQSVKIFSNEQMLKLNLKLETNLFEGLKKLFYSFKKLFIKKVFILGGNGFIGSELVNYFKFCNYDVYPIIKKI